jgi:glycosyltransferase involved in cell wall biosynthesis
VKIALLHPDSPTAEGSGAVHSATLIGESLRSRGHDVVFYCPGEVGKEYTKIKTRELNIRKGVVKNKYAKINDRVVNLGEELATFDIFHSYLMRTIPSVGKVSMQNDSMNAVISLNAYGALCPKNDLLYRNMDQCHSSGPLRCAGCVYNSMSELPPKPDRGNVYNEGRVLHHLIKNMKNYPIVSASDEYKEKIDAFQALSSHVRETYSHFGFPSGKIEVVPNILDNIFEVQHKTEFSEPVRLLYVGELKVHKGVDRLPIILDELNQRGERAFELSVVGKGPLKQDLQDEFEKRDLQNRTAISGFVAYEELPEIYATHDLFVYPGRWQEPFGRVFLESLAAGTPIVSTAVGAVSEIIGSGGEVGESIEDLIGKILSISQDDLRTYSEQATLEAKRFKRDKIVEDIELLYRKTLSS